MNSLTGKTGVFDNIAVENKQMISKRLGELGLTLEDTPQAIREKLNAWLIKLENKLSVQIGSADYNSIVAKALELENPGKGLFIKKAKALEMLKANPPQNILSHFGYGSVDKLVEKEGLEQVYSALRFIEPGEWMNKIFIGSYAGLTIADFEEREVQTIVLNEKWLQTAEKFLQKKYHNVSHLKELGVIFIIPIEINTDGELMRVFTLLLHYLNEVPFYSSLFRKFGGESDFAGKLISLLRGDVPLTQSPIANRQSIMIIQRYLAKDDPNDPRLFIPHVNPEAEHWYKAQKSLGKLPGFADITDYDFVGDFFTNNANLQTGVNTANNGEFISFSLIDLTMTLVKKGESKYLYHQQEALWNKIFIEYLGRGKMNQLIEENIIGGVIKL